MYKFVFGHFNIEDNAVISIDGNLSMSPVMDDLKFDEIRFEFTFNFNKPIYKDDCIKGKPVKYYVNDKLIQKMFISDFKRKSELIYNITLTSIVGVWDKKFYRGNLFNGAVLSDVVEEIVGSEATVSSLVSDIKIYGFLKYSTKREAMHNLLFATGCIILKDYNGDPLITSWSPGDTPREISPDIIDTNNIEYTEIQKASEIIVTEHSYVVDSDAEYAIAFDNTDRHEQVYNSLVKFSVPIQTNDYKTKDAEGHEGSGLVVSHMTPASCEVTGLGQLLVKQYIHSESEQRRKVPDAYETQEMSSSDCTLVCAANSGNVMDRLYGYYTNVKEAKFEMVYNNAFKIGDFLSVPFWNDFYDGYLINVDIVASKMRKAICTTAIGFSIIPAGNNYKYYRLITEGNSFIVPQGINKIRVYVIGGGHGGNSGTRCKEGEEGRVNATFTSMNGVLSELKTTSSIHNYDRLRIASKSDSSGGKGGEAGDGGNGGKGGRSIGIELDVVPGQSFQIQCGKGGIGANGTILDDEQVSPTQDPTPSKIWTEEYGIVSSDSGSYNPLINIFTGESYGNEGKNGKKGAHGGNGGLAVEKANSRAKGGTGYLVEGQLQENPEWESVYPGRQYGSNPGTDPLQGPDIYGVTYDGHEYYAGTGSGAGYNLGTAYNTEDYDGGIIPYMDNYYKADHVTFTGEQYIDTNFIPNLLTTKIEIGYKIRSNAKNYWRAILWTGPNDYGLTYDLSYDLKDSEYTLHNISITTTPSAAWHPKIYTVENINTIYRYVPSSILSECKVTINDAVSFPAVKERYSDELYQMNSTLKIGGNDGLARAKQCFNGDITYIKIWDGDTLVRDFIPLFREDWYEFGLYDRVRNVFHSSDSQVQCSGAFTQRYKTIEPEPGKNPSRSPIFEPWSYSLIGGRGANAVVPAKPEKSTRLGDGGNGGHGPGGPGGGGNVGVPAHAGYIIDAIKEVVKDIFRGRYGNNPDRYIRLESEFPGMYPIFQGLVNVAKTINNVDIIEDETIMSVLDLASMGLLSCPDMYGRSILWQYNWPTKFPYAYGGDPGSIAEGGPGGDGADGGLLIYY